MFLRCILLFAKKLQIDFFKTEKNIKAAIIRIKSFQTVNGGFSYWPGSNYNDDWGSNYAGHFLLEAQKKGFTIPYGMLDSWKRYQQARAQQWQGSKNAFLYILIYNGALSNFKKILIGIHDVIRCTTLYQLPLMQPGDLIANLTNST